MVMERQVMGESHIGEHVNVHYPVIIRTSSKSCSKISGGTGIAPFYQLLHNVYEAVDSGLPKPTSFSLLHSSRSPDELPPGLILNKLESWANSKRPHLSIQMFVDRGDRVGKLNLGRINRDDILRDLRGDGIELSKVLFLVCGPEACAISI